MPSVVWVLTLFLLTRRNENNETSASSHLTWIALRSGHRSLAMRLTDFPQRLPSRRLLTLGTLAPEIRRAATEVSAGNHHQFVGERNGGWWQSESERGSGTSQHADCLLRLTHLRGLHIQNLQVSQSAIYWPNCDALPFHHPPSVRVSYSARVFVLRKTWSWPSCMCVFVCGVDAVQHHQTVHEHFTPTNSIFPFSLRHRRTPPFPPYDPVTPF